LADSPEKEPLVVDATDLMLGRLASLVAKRLLSGEFVTIVNAEKAVISGTRRNILDEMRITLGFRNLGSKKKSPKHPRRPDGLIRRTVRGMLPYDKPKGKEAFERLRVCIGTPTDVDATTVKTLTQAQRHQGTRVMTVGDLARSIGWHSLEV